MWGRKKEPKNRPIKSKKLLERDYKELQISSLFMARALGIILKNTEGIVVNNLEILPEYPKNKKFIVYRDRSQIRFCEYPESQENLTEGTSVLLHHIKPTP